MIFIVLGAILAIFSLIAFLHRPKRQDGKPKRIPGLKPSDPIEGNNTDIKNAKQMCIFVKDLHQRFGPVASFWEGKNLAVSIASPDLLKHLRHMKHTSVEIFEPFRILVGDNCMGLMVGEEVVRRRKLYDHHFQLKGCKSYFTCFIEIAHEYIDKWTNLNPDDHIPLLKTMLEATLKGILRTSYGDYFKDDNSLKHFQNLYDRVMVSIDNTATLTVCEDETVKNDVKEINFIIGNILEKRRKELDHSDQNLFIDTILNDNASDEQCKNDSIMFVGAGYDSTGKVLMWIIYELASHPEIQEKLYEELISVLGNEHVSIDAIPKLVYLRQIIDETLRLRGLTICVGRKSEEELKLDDFVIPANVNVYQAIGYMFSDPNIWPEPEKFDPERFSAKNSKGRNPFSFKPFGFAGKRQCPGQSYAYFQMITFIAEWLRHFQFKLVPGQTIKLFIGTIVKPEEEVWVTLEKRK